MSVYSLTTNVPHHIEISQLTCNANQLTDFYLMGNTGRLWVKKMTSSFRNIFLGFLTSLTLLCRPIFHKTKMILKWFSFSYDLAQYSQVITKWVFKFNKDWNIHFPILFFLVPKNPCNMFIKVCFSLLSLKKVSKNLIWFKINSILQNNFTK